MLDLKELEKRLDEALAKETSESLSSWIINQRKNNLESFLGIGRIQQFKENPSVFNMDPLSNPHYSSKNGNSPNEQLAIAA